MQTRPYMMAFLVSVAFVGTACSSSDAPAVDSVSQMPGQMPGMSMSPGASTAPVSGEGVVGAPGDPAEVDRVVRITQLDDLRFDPSAIELRAGETVKFMVTNEGTIAHEFVLGDEAFQSQHEEEMAGMGGTMMPDNVGAVSVEPGQSKSLVWMFPEAGTVLYGCHVPGHYAGGMKGQISVTP